MKHPRARKIGGVDGLSTDLGQTIQTPIACRFDGRRIRAIAAHELTCSFDRRDNGDVSGTTAYVTAQPMLDLFVARLRVLDEQRVSQQDHARGAVAAFKAALFPKRLLDRMQLIALGQAFDGGYRFAIDL